MKIAIVDDQEMWRVCVEELLKKYYGQNVPKIDHFDCGEDFYNQEKYDVVFLDIEMGQMDGFETAKYYKQNNSDAIIIFLTTHDELSRQGYLVDAFRYIIKSNIEVELEEALNSIEDMHRRNQVIQFHVINMGTMCIKVKDILFIETEKRNVVIHTREHDYISNIKMEDLEEELRELGFFRCHKSYLINLDHVHKFDKFNVYFIDNKRALVSTRKYAELKDRYFEQKFKIANS